MSTPTNDITPTPVDQVTPEAPSPTLPNPTATEVSRLLDTPTPGQPLTESEKP